MKQFTLDVVIAKPGQWRLYRDISGTYMDTLESQGWTIVESWPYTVSTSVAQAAGQSTM